MIFTIYKVKCLVIKDASNRRTRFEHPLKFLSLSVVLFCERPRWKRSDFYNQVGCWELIKQSPHIVATNTFSMSTLPPNLTTLQMQNRIFVSESYSYQPLTRKTEKKQNRKDPGFQKLFKKFAVPCGKWHPQSDHHLTIGMQWP